MTNATPPSPQPPSGETEAEAALRALVATDVSERKRTFSALLRAVIDDRPQGS